MAKNRRAADRATALPNQASPPAGAMPVQAPQLYATTFQMAVAANAFSLILLHPTPMALPGGDLNSGLAALMPSAVIQMSPYAAKDLALLMQDTVEQYEETWGTIETEFTRRRDAGE